MDTVTQLRNYVRGGYQWLDYTTVEGARFESTAQAAAQQQKMHFHTWDCCEGFSKPDAQNKTGSDMNDPLDALAALTTSKFEGNCMFVFRNLHAWYQDPQIVQKLQTLVRTNSLVNNQFKRILVSTSSVRNLHKELEHDVTTLDFDLPSETELIVVFNFVQESLGTASKNKDKAACSDELKAKIIQACLGMTSVEAENIISYCVATHNGFCEEMLETIEDEKANIIKKSDVLEYIPKRKIMDAKWLGGWEGLLPFVDARKCAYSKKAREAGLEHPNGLVILGVPGTGKSVGARAIARRLGLPLIIMDVGALFGGIVGESEERTRAALNTTDAVNGAVLLIDEADKAFANAHDSVGDSGVTKRVFGKILSWLADKQGPTFVVVTMNRIAGVPPEFLRKGRFDEVFWTDIPTDEERRHIMELHFEKRGTKVDELGWSDQEWKHLVSQTDDFVGSELEEVIKDARFNAFSDRESVVPTYEELVTSVAATIPLSTLDKENVEGIRTFCRGRARPVNQTAAMLRPEKPKGGKRSRGVDAG